MIFYVVVAAAQLNLGDLRESGWVFDMAAGGSKESWYKFYQYYGLSLTFSFRLISHCHADHSKVRFAPLWSTLPTQFAL